MKQLVMIAGLSLALSACNDGRQASTRHIQPIPPATLSLMAQKGMSQNDPILVRAYKKESEIEVWKRRSDGQYAHLKTYPICRWSGQLGPKVREGDRQAPEGFYTVNPAHMNPNSSYYLSFDTGYPNAYDRAHGRTGSHLMVHGSCSSSGCFAMTDEAIAEVYAVAREAFAGGQRGFQFQSMPFRMTAQNLAKHRADPHMPFWKNLKEGSDIFEVTRDEPKVAVCGGRYVFGGQGDTDCAPQVEPAVAQKREADEQKVAELVTRGVPAVKTVYADGSQHASFRETMVATAGGESNTSLFETRRTRNLGDVSRPEALEAGPREIAIDTAKAPAKTDKPTALAFASAAKPAAPAKPLEVAKGSDKPAAKSGRVVVASASADDLPVASTAPSAVPALARRKTVKPVTERRADLPTISGAQPALGGGAGFTLRP